MYLSELEMTSETIFRQVLDVNLFGRIRVTKTFLPLIRRSKGRIVNMSSVTGQTRQLRDTTVSIVLNTSTSAAASRAVLTAIYWTWAYYGVCRSNGI